MEWNRVEHRDRRVAALAGSQYGVVSLAQLKGVGLGQGAIEHRVRAGRLHRIERGVYAVGHTVLGADGRRLAAVLSCGPGAVLSHRSAAAHWRLCAGATTRFDVAVPAAGGRRSRKGIAIHRMASLRPDEATIHRGVPITTVARTLLDLATVVSPRALERALEESERLRLFDLGAVEALLWTHRGDAGTRALVDVLTHMEEGETLTRNDLEEAFLAICDQRGLRPPSVNAPVEGFEVDFLWRAERVAVETDGRATHGTRAAFERDRARDARLAGAGYRVVRFSHRQVTREPDMIADTVGSLLAQASARR